MLFIVVVDGIANSEQGSPNSEDTGDSVNTDPRPHYLVIALPHRDPENDCMHGCARYIDRGTRQIQAAREVRWNDEDAWF